MRTGGRPDIGETWKFALCRYDYSVDFEGPELSTCAPLKCAETSTLRGLRDAAIRRSRKGSEQTVGIDKRIPLDHVEGRRLAGTAAAVPGNALSKDLEIPYPIAVEQQPGSDRSCSSRRISPMARRDCNA